MSNYSKPVSTQERERDIRKDLLREYGFNPSPEQFKEMTKPWENYINGYNIISTFDAVKAKKYVDSLINKYTKMLEQNKKFNEWNKDLQIYLNFFHMDELFLNMESPAEFDERKKFEETIFSYCIQARINLLKKTRSFLLKNKSAVVNPKYLEEAAIHALFVFAKRELDLNQGGKGSGNKNQRINFAMIISGLESIDTVEDYYSRYKVLQDATEEIPDDLLI